MNIKYMVLSVLLLTSTASMADKPSWAGNGGKPSDYEKEYHKDKMKSKHKQEKHHEDNDYDRKDSYKKDYHSKYDGSNGQRYEGQGQSDGEFIEQKTDETKKNWIGKFFDFFN